MGAWGHGPWHNDGAWDWLSQHHDLWDALFERVEDAITDGPCAGHKGLLLNPCEGLGFCLFKGEQIRAAAAMLNALKTVFHGSGDMLGGESEAVHSLRHLAADRLDTLAGSGFFNEDLPLAAEADRLRNECFDAWSVVAVSRAHDGAMDQKKVAV